MIARRKKSVTLALAAVLLLLTLGALWLSGTRHSPMRLFPFIQKEQRGPLTKLVEKYWWKVHDRVFGPRPSLLAVVTILKLKNTNGLIFPSEPEDPMLFASTNGLKLWRLKTLELEEFEKRLEGKLENEVVARPNLITTDGMEASMFIGSSVVLNGVAQEIGLTATMLPKISKGSTDLTLWTSFTEFSQGNDTNNPGMVLTNFAATLHGQVPSDSGLFLLSVSSNKESFGMVVKLKTQK